MLVKIKSVVNTTAHEDGMSTKMGTAQDRKDMRRVGRQQKLNVWDNINSTEYWLNTSSAISDFCQFLGLRRC